MGSMISHRAASIYTMVLRPATDRNMTDHEIATLGLSSPRSVRAARLALLSSASMDWEVA